MKHIYSFTCLFPLLFFVSVLYGQRGKNGPLTVSSIMEVNEYTFLTTNAAAGGSTISVANSALNTHNRFNKNLSEGDLIMIIQMQGASILSGVNDSTWGSITNYNNCGLYELCEVSTVLNNTTIEITCPLQNTYITTGNVQVVRIPRYSTLTVNSNGNINCDAWNGQTGGIVAVEVLGATTINGAISADSLGFRGGALLDNSGNTNSISFDSNSVALGGQKGEGIAGYQSQYNIYGGMYGRGAPADGGGGGDQWNASGGGGGNGGDINAYNGNGNPDTTTTAWDSAWSLEYPGFNKNVSSGGGRGGYTLSWFPVGVPDPNKIPPGNSDWGSTDRNRMNAGGKGGRPLDYSTGRIFEGGGGGAGHEDQSLGGPGGNGGGIIYITAYGAVSGSGSIHSNGGAGGNDNSIGNLGDGMGGGGSGGTILINSTNSISGITVKANGGRGGYQYITSSYENEGPGGGGGGGHIALSYLSVTTSLAGGINGITDSPLMTLFPPDGATKGGIGDVDSIIPGFIILTKNDTICSGNHATLTATLSGNVPGGISIEWYDSAAGGIYLGSGSSYTTPVLNVTTVFYVSTCPGDYRQADTVFVTTLNPYVLPVNDSICKGDSIWLVANGGITYLWSTNQTTDSIKVAPLVTTTYSLAASKKACNKDTSYTVYVRSPITGSVTANPDTVCYKGLSNLKALSAGGPATYKWNNGHTNDTINVKPAVTTTYTVTIYGKCDTLNKNVTVHVIPPIVPLIHSSSDSICKGDSLWLAGKGGITYLWSTNQTTDSIKVAPANTTTYTLTAHNGICSDDTTFTVYVRPTVTSSIHASPDTVCPMGMSSLSVTAAGGQVRYKWSTGATGSSISVNSNVTTKYIATVYGTCDSLKDTVTVTVIPLAQPVIKGKLSRCQGSKDTLTVSGGNSYLWSNGSTKDTYVTGNINGDSTIMVIAYNSLGCPDSGRYSIKMLPPPTIALVDTTTCLNNPITIYAVANDTTSLSYLWTPGGETGQSITVPDTGQSFTVTVSNGCISKQSVKLTPVILSFSACCDKLILLGDDTTITAHGFGPGEITAYSWSPKVMCLDALCDSVDVNPKVTTTYTVTGTDSLGCEIERTVTIVVETVCFDFIVPNVFTPTEAGLLGLNNVFYIKTENMSAWSIQIYDRWGNEVFKSTNPIQYWSGNTESGGQAPAGVYYYIINGTCQNNTYKKDGFVQLIR